jgi:hypothetical protein
LENEVNLSAVVQSVATSVSAFAFASAFTFGSASGSGSAEWIPADPGMWMENWTEHILFN